MVSFRTDTLIAAYINLMDPNVKLFCHLYMNIFFNQLIWKNTSPILHARYVYWLFQQIISLSLGPK